MSSESTLPAVDDAASSTSNAPQVVRRPPPVTPATKAATTIARNKARLRADHLADISSQIADGRLVVRQMTVAQHDAAREAARVTSARNEARRARSRRSA